MGSRVLQRVRRPRPDAMAAGCDRSYPIAHFYVVRRDLIARLAPHQCDTAGMMRVAAIAMALCAGGCDYVFRVDHVDLHGDARTGDASDDAHADASLPGLCTATAVDDTFDGAMVCPWGIKFGAATVISGGGVLRIDPPSDGTSGGCDAPVGPFADGGIVGEITQVLGGSAYAYTGIQEFGTFDTSIQVNAGELKFEDPGGGTVWGRKLYDPVAMRWVRIRPDRADSSIVAEYSSDGMGWMNLGVVATPVPVTVKATLIGGVASGAAQISGVAELSRFIVCQ